MHKQPGRPLRDRFNLSPDPDRPGMLPRRRGPGIGGILCLVALWSANPYVGADTLTVGPGGMHATVQAAVDDAVGRGGDHEIHIAEGTFTEPVVLSQINDRLELSGGWSNAFSERADDPSLTVISGGDTSRVFDLDGARGRIRIFNLTISGGFQDGIGAGLYVRCTDCTVELAKLYVRDNMISRDKDDFVVAGGAAVYAVLKGDARLSIDKCEIRDNRVASRAIDTGAVFLSLSDSSWAEISDSTLADNLLQSSEGRAQGGGLHVRAVEDSAVSVRGNTFVNNTVQSGTSLAEGGGVYLRTFDDATYSVRGNEFKGNVGSESPFQVTAPGALVWSLGRSRGHFSDNRILDNESGGPGGGLGIGSAIWASDNSMALAERNLWLANIVTMGRQADQLSLNASDSARIVVRDSVVAAGNGFGVLAVVGGAGSTLGMTNLTVTGHPGVPFSKAGGDGEMSVFNSIFFDNCCAFSPGEGVETGNNLTDEDPLFQDAASHDYRLQPGSPALNAGTNTPPEGLGGADLDWNLRISGPSVDAGAYEVSDGPGRMQFLTQMGNGRIGDIVLDTGIDAANVGSQGEESLIISFLDSAGEPWDIDVQGQGVTPFVAVSLGPGESATFKTAGLGDIRSGYARLESGPNIGGTGIFTRTDGPSGTALYQAGVPLSEGLDVATLFVDSLGDLATGVALVNIEEAGPGPAGDGVPEVSFDLYDQEFNLVEQTTRPLAAGHHEALFVSQLFPQSAQAQEMQGVLQIRGPGADVALVTLRQNDAPGLEFPDEVPTLAAFPVLPGAAAPAGASPLVFYLAQVGNGRQGPIGLQTSLSFANTSAIPNNVRVEFFQSSGAPMVLTLEGRGTSSIFDFLLQGGQSVVAQTDGLGDITAGYARVSTFEGIGGVAVFSQLDVPSGILETESGVPASIPTGAFSIFVDTVGDADTGLALVNPGLPPAPAGAGGTATIELTLFDTEGQQLDQQELSLGAGEHTAKFVSQLFSSVDPIGEMRGLIAVSSDIPIAAVTLKQNNNPLLSFPEDVATLTAFPVLPETPLP